MSGEMLHVAQMPSKVNKSSEFIEETKKMKEGFCVPAGNWSRGSD